MEIFEDLSGMGHERVVFCSNPEVGLKAIIAVHSTVLGPGLGGCRMWSYGSDQEALTDVLRLSRGMTYKAAAAGLNLGGGKAVILGDAKRDKTEELFRAFGRAVESLGGQYITAEDVGTGLQDMEQVSAETRWVTGVSPDLGGGGDPSPVTAFGVLQGIKAAAAEVFGSDSLRGHSIAVQGLGNVGFALATYLVRDEKATVVACDIDREATARANSELGIEIVATDSIHTADVDVFAPCALGAGLNETTIPQLRCRIVAGAANNQLAEEDRDGEALHGRGILYAPDFVINAGGLINVYDELFGYNRERAMRRARGIYQNVARVFATAARDGVPTHVAAARLAEERIQRVRAVGPRAWDRKLKEMRR